MPPKRKAAGAASAGSKAKTATTKATTKKPVKKTNSSSTSTVVVKSKPVAAQNPPSRTLYVRNLDDKVGTPRVKKTLYLAFTAAIGSSGIVEAVVIRKAKGLRGQAFVRLDNVQAATKVRRTLNGAMILGKEISIDYAQAETRARPPPL